MTPQWRRPFYKVSDIIMELLPEKTYWPADCHEPLLIDHGRSDRHQPFWVWKGTCIECGKRTPGEYSVPMLELSENASFHAKGAGVLNVTRWLQI
eukprot:1769192-Ditylum_brightwellii.AAC.1